MKRVVVAVCVLFFAALSQSVLASLWQTNNRGEFWSKVLIYDAIS